MLRVPKFAAYLVLAVLVAAAVYLVYTSEGINSILPQREEGEAMGHSLDPGEDDQSPLENDAAGNTPADWELDNSRNFFVEYRLERERVRSQEIDLLQQLVNNPNVSEESKAEAERKLLKIQGCMEIELLVEHALRAQNFDEAILIMQEEGAMVIVAAQDLSSQQILQIAEIAAKSTGLRSSQIKISNQLGK